MVDYRFFYFDNKLDGVQLLSVSYLRIPLKGKSIGNISFISSKPDLSKNRDSDSLVCLNYSFIQYKSNKSHITNSHIYGTWEKLSPIYSGEVLSKFKEDYNKYSLVMNLYLDPFTFNSSQNLFSRKQNKMITQIDSNLGLISKICSLNSKSCILEGTNKYNKIISRHLVERLNSFYGTSIVLKPKMKFISFKSSTFSRDIRNNILPIK
ncbi:MAG: hypothetical protein HRU03_03425 [Nanoarchaeales archaeon]|nr:hypothetical protein [Nanoarchaeales archaeon]